MKTYNAACAALEGRYLVARYAWLCSNEVREAATTLNMSEREYCDRFVALNYGPLMWLTTGTTIGGSERLPSADEAFTAAGRLLAAEKA